MIRALFLGLMLACSSAWSDSVLVGNAVIETEPGLKYPLVRPTDIPVIASGEATLEELLKEGEQNWYHGDLIRGEPFGVPEELYELKQKTVVGWFQSKFRGWGETFTPLPLMIQKGFDLPVGMTRIKTKSGSTQIVQNCSACHTAHIKGKLYPGLTNKNYDQTYLFKTAEDFFDEKLIKQLSPQLQAEAREQLWKLRNHRALENLGCEADQRPGTTTTLRIWQIGSSLLKLADQIQTPEQRKDFPCGGVGKPTPLNTLRFRNLYFPDGKINALFVPPLPAFHFMSGAKMEEYRQLYDSRMMQSVNAFMIFGTKSPAWNEVFKESLNRKLIGEGYGLFHGANSCSSCHGTYGQDGKLLTYREQIIPLGTIGTDPDRSALLEDRMITGIEFQAVTEKTMGRKPGYLALPLCSTFLNYPYLHSGSVSTLRELLEPWEKRSELYFHGGEIDTTNMGFFTPKTAERPSLGARPVQVPEKYRRGHSGAAFGTELKDSQKRALVEYLKTLTCPDGP